ncbi:MAG: RNA 3'-phosphate cyclase [Desulfomonile tiedjei]|nr:RNA 3'-phosphate cyclase [Desulfomonile tiedjei]
MIEIDGATHSGSGTILRYSMALATLRREPLHIVRIRAKRPKPGLRAQHLSAARACASVSAGSLEGAEVGSQEIVYRPGNVLKGGEFHFDIGTAGSTTMLAFTLIPPALFAESPSRFIITGGLFQDFAPSFFHMKKVLVPILREMGADVRLEMIRPGYVPRGAGRLKLELTPLAGPLGAFRRVEQGRVKALRGISLASHLSEQQVCRRMADRCVERLRKRAFAPEIELVEDSTAAQKGAALLVWAETDSGCLIGADQAGAPGRRSEAIGDFVARTLLEDLDSGAVTDRHVADQLILFAALARGTTEYTVPFVTDHVKANLWLVQEILGVQTHLRDNHVRVEGIGFRSH